jgi:hypothetical protein
MRGAHLGYDVTDPTRLHTGLGVGRPTPGRSSFRSETSRRRLFARRLGAARSYQIPQPCQARPRWTLRDRFGRCSADHP